MILFQKFFLILFYITKLQYKPPGPRGKLTKSQIKAFKSPPYQRHLKFYDQTWFSGTEKIGVNYLDKRLKIDGRRRRRGRKNGDGMTDKWSWRGMKG